MKTTDLFHRFRQKAEFGPAVTNLGSCICDGITTAFGDAPSLQQVLIEERTERRIDSCKIGV
jgi:hypothetical protein